MPDRGTVRLSLAARHDLVTVAAATLADFSSLQGAQCKGILCGGIAAHMTTV